MCLLCVSVCVSGRVAGKILSLIILEDFITACLCVFLFTVLEWNQLWPSCC